MPRDEAFSKQRADAPPGFFAVEAAGLRWLAAAQASGGVPVVTPIEVRQDRIVLPRLVGTAPDGHAARTFGRQLAATHRAGAAGFGCPPDGWSDDGYIGPLALPLVRPDGPAELPANPPEPLAAGSPDRLPELPPDASGRAPADWGPFFATFRLQPYARTARDSGALSVAGARAVDRVCERLADGDAELTGPADPPARLHGDLWSGNVVWTASGVVLVDPAAHGGHRETDLAMLALFGLPQLESVLAGYIETAPPADGWQDRVGLHQLHPLLVHAVLFGGGYGAQAERVARRYT